MAEATVIDNLSQKIGGLDAEAARSFKPNIIRVPDDIRKGHDEAYVPRMFFIGPYHMKDSPMQETKLLYLNDLLSRDPQNNKVSCYVKEIFKDLEKARKQYSDRDCVNQISDEDFVEMLVVDGCFIIELLLKRAGTKDEQPNFDKLRTSSTLRRDLLLLENQIPFFVLRIILKNSNRRRNIPGNNNTTLVDLALNYLTGGRIQKNMLIQENQEEGEIYHLLHLSYLCHVTNFSKTQPPRRDIRYYVSLFVFYFIYCTVYVLVVLLFWRKPNWSPSNKESTENARMIPSASELHEAGVTFKRKDKNTKLGYLDVSFDREGFFHIPHLSIQESTESVFRNFLAFEQTCNLSHPVTLTSDSIEGNSFTSYVVLMDNLINTSTDVAILKRNGVLHSKLGCDDDVAKLFNEMRSGLCFDFDKHYLLETFKDANSYWNKAHNRWRAKLKHDYFGNPWSSISVVAAVVVIVFTAMQTVYSVLSFYE